MVKRKKRLYNPCNPEKSDKPGDEHEHFPAAYCVAGKMAFGKDNADNKEDYGFHQLEKLEPRDVVY